MFYALNLFDLKDEAVYRKYLTRAGQIVQELGGDLVVMGRRAPPFEWRPTSGGPERRTWTSLSKSSRRARSPTIGA
jgi:hypothetical protein